MTSMRFRVEIRDVPANVAARKLGMTLEAFTDKLPDLQKRGFPMPDQTTGNFDLKAIERWQDARHPLLIPAENSLAPQSGTSITRERLKSMQS